MDKKYKNTKVCVWCYPLSRTRKYRKAYTADIRNWMSGERTNYTILQEKINKFNTDRKSKNPTIYSTPYYQPKKNRQKDLDWKLLPSGENNYIFMKIIKEQYKGGN